jgi:hypothetical protein
LSLTPTSEQLQQRLLTGTTTLREIRYRTFPHSWAFRSKGAWLKALAAADEVLDGGGRLADPTRGALNYHSNSVDPYWRAGLRLVAQVGNHLFYRPPASGDPADPAAMDALPAAAGPPPRVPEPAAAVAKATFGRAASIRVVRGGVAERVRVVRERP